MPNFFCEIVARNLFLRCEVHIVNMENSQANSTRSLDRAESELLLKSRFVLKDLPHCLVRKTFKRFFESSKHRPK